MVGDYLSTMPMGMFLEYVCEILHLTSFFISICICIMCLYVCIYRFGIVNAAKAVDLAMNWTLLSPQVGITSGLIDLTNQTIYRSFFLFFFSLFLFPFFFLFFFFSQITTPQQPTSPAKKSSPSKPQVILLSNK